MSRAEKQNLIRMSLASKIRSAATTVAEQLEKDYAAIENIENTGEKFLALCKFRTDTKAAKITVYKDIKKAAAHMTEKRMQIVNPAITALSMIALLVVAFAVIHTVSALFATFGAGFILRGIADQLKKTEMAAIIAGVEDPLNRIGHCRKASLKATKQLIAEKASELSTSESAMTAINADNYLRAKFMSNAVKTLQMLAPTGTTLASTPVV